MMREKLTPSESFRIADASLQERSEWFVQSVNKWLDSSRDRIFVLLVDSILEKQYHSLLPKLETYLLDPIARHNRVLVILSGRSQSTGLTKAYVRPSKDDISLLDRFEKTHDIVEQIRRYRNDKDIQSDVTDDEERVARTIQELSDGYPEIAAWIIEQAVPASKQLERVTTNSIVDSAKRLYDRLIERILSAEDYAKELRPYFEALSVLDGFKLVEANELVQTYFFERKQDTPSNQAEQIARLVSTQLVFFEKGNYFINSSLRFALNNYLKYNKTQLWLALHKRAQVLYGEWAEEYSELKEYFEARASYHKEEVLKANLSEVENE